MTTFGCDNEEPYSRPVSITMGTHGREDDSGAGGVVHQLAKSYLFHSEVVWTSLVLFREYGLYREPSETVMAL